MRSRGLGSLSILAVFGVLTLALAPSVARGQGGTQRTLGVIINPATDADRIEVGKARPVLERQLTLLDGVSYRDATVSMPASDRDNLNRRINDGFAALDQGDFQRAHDALAEVERRLQVTPANPDTVFSARYFKAYGCALVGIGEQTRGVARIKTSLFLFPSQRAEEYGYTMETRTAFLKARNEIGDLDPGTLRIDADPMGSSVFVDGVFQGLAPLKMSKIPAGEHLVRVAREGYQQKAALVMISPSAEAEASLSLVQAPYRQRLEASLATLATTVESSAAAPLLREAKLMLGVDELAVIRVSVSPEAFVATGFYLNRADKAFGLDDSIERSGSFDENAKNYVAFLTGAQVMDEYRISSLGGPAAAVPGPGVGGAAVAEDLIIDPNSPMFAEARKKKGKKSILTEWWFIGGVAVLTTGAITGVYFLTQTSGATDSAATGSIRVEVAPY